MTNEQLHEIAYEIYESMLPSVINSFGRKYVMMDRINSIEDFKSHFYLVVYNSVCIYHKNRSGKGNPSIIEWKKNNGKATNHRMKIQTFIIEQLKKELDNLNNLTVVIRKGNYTEKLSYSQFTKRRAYLKANGFTVEFMFPDVLFSELSGPDSENFDPENYRAGLKEEINSILYE